MKLLSIFMLLVALLMPAVHAEDDSFTTEEQSAFLWKTGVSRWDDAQAEYSITCFDVNTRGDVAVGMEAAHSRCYIGVFDSDGQWLYGYSFFCHGSFAVEWAGTDAITIYWERSSVSGTFDAQANCIELVKWRDDKAWNQRTQALSGTERIVDGTRYVLDANLGILTPFATGYSRVLRYAED